MSDKYAPRPENRFSFGFWTVGNRGRDPFGDVVRDAHAPNDAVAMLAEVGAWGGNLHDNDLVPIDTTPAERDPIVGEFTRPLFAINLPVSTLFAAPHCLRTAGQGSLAQPETLVVP